MNDTYRDAVIRAALMPADDVRPPVGLADEIHRRLLVTPQQPRSVGGRVPGRRWMPALSPMTLLLLLLLALAGIVAGAALLLTRESAAPAGVLSYHGGPGRTGVMAGPGPVTEPVVEWEVRLPRGLKEYAMPLVSEGTIFVVDVRGDALAFDLDTGRQRWSVALPADVSGTPLIASGLLVVPADDGIVRALDLATGSIAWATDLGARAGSSVGGWDELAFVGADDGQVHALEVATGAERWTVDAGGPVVKAPAIEDGIAHVVVNDGPVTAFDAVTGAIRWTKGDLGPGEYPTPSIHDGVLYVVRGVEGGGQPYELIALDVGDRGRVRAPGAVAVADAHAEPALPWRRDSRRGLCHRRGSRRLRPRPGDGRRRAVAGDGRAHRIPGDGRR